MKKVVKKRFDFLYKHKFGDFEYSPEIVSIISNIDKEYKKIKIKKKNGSVRLIKPPSERLIKIQKSIKNEIKHLVFKGKVISNNIFGLGGKDKNIQANAKAHQNNRYIFKADIKNFFDNVKPAQVKECLINFLSLKDKEVNLLTRLTTYEHSLPQGAPTSTILASLCLISMDKRISTLCKMNNARYTRYVDDIVISSSKEIKECFVKKVKKIVNQEGFNMHSIGDDLNSKTKIFDTNKEDASVNNLIIRDNKLMTEYHHGFPKHQFLVGSVPIEENKDTSLDGVLNFIRETDEDYFNELIKNKCCPNCLQIDLNDENV